MTDSYDQFPSHKHALIRDFTFQPSRFEVWKDSTKIDSGGVTSPIQANVRGRLNQGAADILVDMAPAESISHIGNSSIYDICITAIDRIQLLTIPEKKNRNESIGLAMCRMVTGATRREKEFDSDEPYCCNMFFKDGFIAKITFSLNHPEKLVEFYL